MEKDLLKIIEHFGVNNQQRKLQEEVFELQEIILDYEFSKENFPKQHEICEDVFKEKIIEEISDVMVLLEQFKTYYEITNEEITNIFWNKVARTLERIESGYYEK